MTLEYLKQTLAKPGEVWRTEWRTHSVMFTRTSLTFTRVPAKVPPHSPEVRWKVNSFRHFSEPGESLAEILWGFQARGTLVSGVSNRERKIAASQAGGRESVQHSNCSTVGVLDLGGVEARERFETGNHAHFARFEGFLGFLGIASRNPSRGMCNSTSKPLEALSLFFYSAKTPKMNRF